MQHVPMPNTMHRVQTEQNSVRWTRCKTDKCESTLTETRTEACGALSLLRDLKGGVRGRTGEVYCGQKKSTNADT